MYMSDAPICVKPACRQPLIKH